MIKDSSKDKANAPIKIAVIQTPKISNFTDFDALSKEDDVNLYYVKEGQEIGDADLILLPGSKTLQKICFICVIVVWRKL